MGEYRLLVHQFPQVAIGLQHRGADAAQQPRLDLARHAEHRGRDGDDQDHLHRLQQEVDHQRHNATMTRSAIKVQNTSVK